MLSIQGGGLCPQGEGFLEIAEMKPADSMRSRGKPQLDWLAHSRIPYAKVHFNEGRQIFSSEGSELEASQQSVHQAGSEERESYPNLCLILNKAQQISKYGGIVGFQRWTGARSRRLPGYFSVADGCLVQAKARRRRWF
ncbi:MAG: hypothetical protein LBU32_29645 [Clostridiales bacterium]|jgi:hypothetical protein|nr:hypothetical protein [Clostridiales bacterium]